jgi:methylase of polypeptide subunit release factors
MDLAVEQRRALKQFRSLLADSGMDKLLAAPDCEQGRPEPLQTVARLFGGGQAADTAQVERCVPPAVISALQALGLLNRAGDTVTAGEYRLVHHLGLFLFCHTLTASAKLYYGNDSLALSRLLLPVEGRALDLCTGVGTQALVCAQTAASVTAVDVEPLAERVFWINAELNGLSEKVEFLVGDLLEPVAGRQFDRICCNPPFMPVPPCVRYPRFADGGPDGLAIVRRLLAGLPEALAPDGLCQVVGAVLGNSDGPDLSALESMAAGARLKLELSSPTCEELDDAMLASCAATALACEGGGDVKQAFRDHWSSLGATRIYYYLLSATHASQPTLYFSHDDVHRAMIG